MELSEGNQMNLALIGYGRWGKIWEKVILYEEIFTLKYIFTPRMQNDGYKTNQFSDMLSSTIDCAIVAAPTNCHYGITKQLLEHGKHVLCEKPLTLNIDQATELIKIAYQNNLILETNYSYLFSPSILHMLNNFSQISPIIAVEISLDGFGAFYDNESVYSVHIPHILAVLLKMFPNQSYTITKHDISISDKGRIDVGVVHLKDKDGINIYIHSSLTGVNKERKILLYGKNGTIEYNALQKDQLKIVTFERTNDKISITNTINNRFDENLNLNRSLHNFYNLIAHNGTSNSQISLEVTKLLERII